jgi:hypothetical protein
MGTVYLAEDTYLKRQVALKFLRSGRSDSQDAALRLLREGEPARVSALIARACASRFNSRRLWF